jgi:ketosteroid isomerase-like protein
VVMSNEQLIRQTWAAISDGDLTALETVLAPDAKWRAVEDGPWNCKSREAIIDRMKANIGERRLSGKVEEVIDLGARAIVAFRPNREPGEKWDEPWPLDNGIRFVVVTTQGGFVTEIKGCADRQTAFDFAEAS